MVIALHPGDIAAIVVYFLIIVAVGLWTTLRGNKGSSAGYFLAGRDMTWLPIGASVFASNVGAPMFIGLAGGAAAGGIAITTFEWHAVYMILLLGWLFLPVYIASGCATMPEYMRRRFGGSRLRILYSVQSLLMYILVTLLGQMYAGALIVKYLLGWNVYLSAFILVILTVVYTIAGGLSTVMWTDTVQSGIIILGAGGIAIKSLYDFGGYENLREKYMIASADGVIETHTRFGNWSCAHPREDSFNIWRDAVTGDLPWPGMVFGLTSIAMFVWCNDQIMVQRALAAKNLHHAKGGAVFASFLKLLSFLLFTIPGLASRVLFPDYVACASPETCLEKCGSELGCSNYAYPLLVMKTLPVGVTGVVLAAILSALMSSLTSILNSASSIFTLDMWTRCRPKAKEAEKMIVGRLFVLFLSGVAIALMPILDASGSGLFWNYIQAVTSYIAPPCSTCFLVAVLWNRATEQGAFWSLIIGLAIGIIRMVLDFYYGSPICGSGEIDVRPDILAKVHYLHFAILLAGICFICMVAVSLLTKPRSKEQLRRMTWWTKDDELEAELSDNEEDQREDNSIEETPGRDATTDVVTKESWKSKLLFWLCGVHLDKIARPQTDPEIHPHKNLSLRDQNQTSSMIVNISAVICLCVTTFLFGFFG